MPREEARAAGLIKEGPLGLAAHLKRRRLRDGPHDNLVDVDVRGPGYRKDDALGNILSSQRLEARVHGLGGGAIALEADDAELGLDKPGCDLGDANRLAVELEPQRARDGAHGVLHRRVSRASL